MPQQGEGSDSASTEEEKVDDSSMSTMQEMSEDIYIVEKGDTLAKISKKVYGDSGHVDAICRMNGLSDGNLIFIGQKLILANISDHLILSLYFYSFAESVSLYMSAISQADSC